MRITQIVTCILFGIGCGALIWYRCGYELGHEVRLFTRIANMFLVGMFGFWCMVSTMMIGVCRKWVFGVLAVLSFLWSINSDHAKNTFFKLGAQSRLLELVPEGVTIKKIEKLSYYSPWLLTVNGKVDENAKKEVWIGTGRVRPWCVLVSDTVSVEADLSTIPRLGFQDEWYQIEAITRLSEGRYGLINRRGLQFFWTFACSLKTERKVWERRWVARAWAGRPGAKR